MIEMRVIDRGFYGMEYQYRHHRLEYDWYKGKVNPPFQGADWSEWKTAPVLKEEEIEND